MVDIVGTSGDDTLFSLSSVDTISGLTGNDRLVWNQGDNRDLFFGGEGDDTILSRTANFQGLQNTFDAGSASIEAIGRDSNNNNQANTGQDLTISADNGSQNWDFSAVTFLNNDVTIMTGRSDDTVTASDEGPGSYFGGDGSDSLIGGSARDVLVGNSGDDEMSGNGGVDTLIGGAGTDDLSGGDARDLFIWNGGHGRDGFDGGDGTDTILSRTASFQGLQNNFDAGAASIEAIGRDSNGNNQANTGQDLTISADNGSQNWDFSAVTFLNNDVTVTTGRNDDTVTASDEGPGSYFGGDGSDSLIGGSARDVLVGNSGDDEMSGNGGVDTLIGGAGTDDLSGGDARDLFVWDGGHGRDAFDGGEGNDTILSRTASFQGLQNSFDAGAAGIEAIGRDSNSNNQANTGQDLTIAADNGSQTWDFSAVTFLNNNVTVTTGRNDDTVTASNEGPGSYFGGNGNDVLIGGAERDVLVGNSGDDVLSGNGGTDTLIGGAGSDEMDGGAARDLFIWNAGHGRDSFDGGQGNDTILSRNGNFEGLQNDFDAGGDGIEAIGRDFNGNNKANTGQDLLISANNGEQNWNFSDVTFLNNEVTVTTGNGEDTLTASDNSEGTYFGGNSNDVLTGGAEKDSILGNSGNDLGVFFGEDPDQADNYNGGAGNGDTLRIGLTPEQLTDGAIGTLVPLANDLLAEIDDYRAHIESNSDVPFTFTQFGNDAGTDLSAVNWENIEVGVVVNGTFISLEKCLDQGIASVLVGTNSAEALNGDNANNLILGLNGNDVINGGRGRDCIFGDAGSDTILVRTNEAEFDHISGGSGTDTVLNTDASHVTFNAFNTFDDIEELDANGQEVRGNGGSNTFNFDGVKLVDVDNVQGRGGADAIQASSQTGNVDYFGGTGNDVLSGANKADNLFGDVGSDTLTGAGGNDLLNGGAGQDDVSGGAGSDVIEVQGNQAETDAMSGGSGTDTVINVAANHVTFAAFNTEDDIEELDANGQEVRGNGGANELDFVGVKMVDVAAVRGLGGADTIEASSVTGNVTYFGGTANDVLIGANKADTLFGDAGADELSGNGGNDVLDGGAGGDDVSGGAGSDTILVQGNQAEFDTIFGGSGTDSIVNQGNGHVTFDVFNVSLDIEELDGNSYEVRGNGGQNDFDFTGVKLVDVDAVRAGGQDDDIQASSQTNGVSYFGGTGNDQLTGANKADHLFGDDGGDTLEGNGGDDVLNGGLGQDDVRGGAGSDIIQVQGDQAEFDTMAGGSGSDSVVNLANSHVVFNAFNTFDDIEELDANGQEVRGNANANAFDFDGVALVGVTAVRGLGGDDVFEASSQTNGVSYFGGTGNDQLIGANKVDSLFGDAGSDTLEGGNGNDFLNGGSGSDDMTGGAGSDTFAFDGGLSGDEGTITDFGSGNDAFLINVASDGSSASYVGDGAFTGGGDASARFESGNLEVDTNGNGSANFTVELTGITLASQLTGGDFIFT
ncbi:MAG: calcium-binding protein [Pseudomonadota bacterium]